MTSSIFIKRSSLSGSVPATSILSPGELAINLGDGGLFYENVTSSIVELIRAGTASFAVTAAFAENAGGGGGGSNSGSFTGSFTGSLLGTASWADNVISASHAVTAAFALNGGGGGGGGGDPVVSTTYTFFDPDFQDPVFADLHNDEFDVSGTLKSIWTKQNFAETTASIENNILTLTGQSVNLTIRRLEQIPSGSAWTMRAKVAYRGEYVSQGYIGIFVQNKASTKLETFAFGHSSGPAPQINLFAFNNPTSFNSEINPTAITTPDVIDWVYLEIHYDGAALIYRYSWNGISWEEHASRTTGSFLGAEVDRIGIWGLADTSNNDYTSSVDWFRFITGSAKTGKHLNNTERTVVTSVTGGGLSNTGSFSGSFSGSFTGTFIGDSDATGSLLGTASWADNATSASHALVADSADLATSAVTAITASNADTASFANPSLFTAHRPIKTVVDTNPYDVIFPDATILINASSGTAPIVVQLPGTALFMNGPNAKILTVVKSAGANDVEVVASGTENVTGDPSASLVSQYQSVTLQPSGGTWWAL